MLTFATLFSGIGAPDLAAERVGLKPLWLCEIAPFQQKVLAKRFPGLPIYDDIRTLTGAERPDILWASPPCQDLSVAGRRAGLAGARSGLFWDFVRVARELQPTWLLMEQVPGLFSSNGGRDFEQAIAALDELGYGLSWRVLDSRYLGVPQRRRRIYVVGSLGGPCPIEVLFESEGGGGDLAAGRAQGADVAGTLGGGTPGARGWRGDLDSSGAYVPGVGRALTGVVDWQSGGDADTLVAHTLRSAGFDASEDGTGRGTPMVVDWQSGGDSRGLDPTYDETRALHAGQTPAVFQLSNGEARDQDGTVPIITGHSGPTRHGGRSGTQQPLVLRMREGKEGGGKGPLIREGESLTLATANDQTLFAPASVRRLTPTECERLQGFPDGWTCLEDIPYDTNACKCPDGPRYAALGNAVTVNAAEWILRRLTAQEEVAA